jgi:hypothetical protein
VAQLARTHRQHALTGPAEQLAQPYEILVLDVAPLRVQTESSFVLGKPRPLVFRLLVQHTHRQRQRALAERREIERLEGCETLQRVEGAKHANPATVAMTGGRLVKPPSGSK